MASLKNLEGENGTDKAVGNLYTVSQVAELFGISEKQVFSLKARGKLPYIKIGRSTRFEASDLRQFIDERKQVVT